MDASPVACAICCPGSCVLTCAVYSVYANFDCDEHGADYLLPHLSASTVQALPWLAQYGRREHLAPSSTL